jgi:hypothetical protein
LSFFSLFYFFLRKFVTEYSILILSLNLKIKKLLLLFKVIKIKHLYYNTRILCVCLTLYRLDPWTSYKLKTGIIKTIRTWTRDFQQKKIRRVTSGQIFEIFYIYNSYIFFPFILNGPTSSYWYLRKNLSTNLSQKTKH